MSKAEETRLHILQQAAQVFNQRGYAGTSMSELMAATGLKKGGIYNHFASKDELAIAAFDYAIQQMQLCIREVVANQPTAIAQLHAMVDYGRRMVTDPPIAGGCPILNTAIEADDTHPDLRAKAGRALQAWQLQIQRIVQTGIRQGELRQNLEPTEVAIAIIAMLEGALMMSRLGDARVMEVAIAHLHHYLEELRHP